MVKRKPHVLLLMGRHGAWHDLLLGLTEYVSRHTSWVLDIAEPTAANVDALSSRAWNGVIGHINTRETYERVAAWKVPTVNTSQDLALESMPEFVHTATDNEAVGALIADYFLKKGHQSFAYLGWEGHCNSLQREQGFVRRLEQAELPCRVIRLSDPPAFGPLSLNANDLELLEWLKRLPRPTALFACNDSFAFRTSQICVEGDIRVPEHLAIMGVYNDPLVCRLGRPPLSSVALLGQREGWEAARLLEEFMSGRIKPSTLLKLPPSHVVTRQSTDLLAIDDAPLAKALRLIQAKAPLGLDVSEVARQAGLNRRALERRFLSRLGRSPGQEIRRVCLEQAKWYLSHSSLSMEAIAEKCGFCGSQWMSVVFQKTEGTSPTAYRRRLGLPYASGLKNAVRTQE